jgi:hypothetical protein
VGADYPITPQGVFEKNPSCASAPRRPNSHRRLLWRQLRERVDSFTIEAKPNRIAVVQRRADVVFRISLEQTTQ